MKPDDIDRYARALVRWDPASAGAFAARRVCGFQRLGDADAALRWQEIEHRARLLAGDGAKTDRPAVH
ncbi:MAG: hypothetical protein HXY25_13030 [Alphaproteobacteria bacterium]|nr:hypothetical protein [Alphaproteobacteria bacterium]